MSSTHDTLGPIYFAEWVSIYQLAKKSDFDGGDKKNTFRLAIHVIVIFKWLNFDYKKYHLYFESLGCKCEAKLVFFSTFMFSNQFGNIITHKNINAVNHRYLLHC